MQAIVLLHTAGVANTRYRMVYTPRALCRRAGHYSKSTVFKGLAGFGAFYQLTGTRFALDRAGVTICFNKERERHYQVITGAKRGHAIRFSECDEKSS